MCQQNMFVALPDGVLFECEHYGIVRNEKLHSTARLKGWKLQKEDWDELFDEYYEMNN